MDQDTLVNPQVSAGQWFIGEFNKYVPINAAYWLRSEGEEDWFLYVASDKIDDTNFDLAYGEVLRIAAAARNPWLDPLRVKVVGADDPVARAIAKFANQHPGHAPVILHGATLDGVWVDGAIVYPPLSAAAAAPAAG